jgi:Bacterial Ig-like domain (group 3)
LLGQEFLMNKRACFVFRLRLADYFSVSSGALTGRVLAVILLGLFVVGGARAQTCTVTDNSDNPADTGSLRYCINTASSGEIINFATSNFATTLNGTTITLNSANGPLAINTNLTLQGPGANLLTISGANSVEVFFINSGTVSISGVTIADGKSSVGGGLINYGALTVSNSMFSGNSSGEGSGGGIYNLGALAVSSTTFSGNTAIDGGGIWNQGTLIVTNSTFSGNSASYGGGIYNNTGGTLTLSNGTFSGNNAAPGSSSGAILNTGGATLVVSNTILLSGDTCISASGGCPTNGSNGNVMDDASTVNLLPLGFYGGTTKTMLPVPGSRAICAGLYALVPSGVTTDQRGFPLNSSCVDAGAVQTNYVMVTTLADVTDGSPDCASGTGSTCSLRDAISIGNTASYADIAFASSLNGGTITLASPLPMISGHINLSGPGANQMTISGGNSSTVGSVLTANSAAEVVLSGITIANGYSSSFPQYGGGLYSTGGKVAVNNSVFTGNYAWSGGGGGIYCQGGTLTVTNSTFTQNTGGGLWCETAIVTVRDSRFSGNYGFDGSGIVINSYGRLNVSNSTVSGNTAANVAGGIYNGYMSSLTLRNSTISANIANNSGGGIFNVGTFASSDSTISGNTANGSGSYGAPITGGGIYIYIGSVALSNTIVAGNMAPSGYADIYGTYTDNGGNQASNNPSSTSSIAINLAPVGNYGGVTQTMLPLPGSPAICGGLAANIPTSVTTDQRGFPNTNTSYTGYSSNSPCVDAGAVQTNYQSMQFNSTSYSGNINQAITPAPVISVTENGQNIGGVPVTLGFSGTGTASGLGPVTSVAGSGATFSSLSVNMTGSDMLSASLAIVSSFSLSGSASLTVIPVTVSTATTITSSVNPSTAGQSVTFTATVAPSSGTGTPSGTVSFSDGATTLGTGTLNTSGQATYATSSLTQGTHSITASYSGDSQFDASTSVALSQVVNAYVPVTLTVTSLADDNSAGSLRYAIANAHSGDTITFSVAGTITLTQGVLGINKDLTISGPGRSALTISGGHNCTVFQIDSGTTAKISGLTLQDGVAGVNGQDISNSGMLTVAKSALLMTTASNGEGGGIFNTGTLTVSDSSFVGTSNVGVASDGGGIFNAGTSTVINSTFSIVGAGNGGAIFNTGTLTVSDSSFVGSLNYGIASYGGGIFNDRGGTATVINTTFSSLGVGGYGGAILTRSTLTVINSTFWQNNANAGGAIFNDGGGATIVSSTFSNNWASGTGGAALYNLNAATSMKNTILANSPPDAGNCAVNGGALVSYGHNLSDDNSCAAAFNQTGDVHNTPAGLDPAGLKDNGGPTQTIGLISGSPAIDAVSVSPTNYCTDIDGNVLQTDQRGTTRPQGAACDIGAVERMPGISTVVTLASSANPSTVNQSLTLTATVAPSSGTGTPSGNVTFKDGTTTLGIGTVNNGQAAFTTSSLSLGTHSIITSYSGDTQFDGSTSAALSQVINLALTTTTLTSSINPSNAGQSVAFTATVSPNSGTGTPSGTVIFKDGTATLGSVTLNAAGQATYTTASLTVGTHFITASYGGDSQFNVSASTAMSQVVNKISTVTALVSSLNPSTFGQLVTLTATVSSSGGTPTGSVTFYDGATTLGTAALNPSGQAKLSTAGLNGGVHSITAAYSGDSTFATSTSSALSQNVNRAATTTTVSSSPSPSIYGQAVTLSVTVSSSVGVPTGTVTFYDGGTMLGMGILSSGRATLSTAGLSAGTHSITANYSGDTNFATSTSNAVSQTIAKATTTTTLTSSPNPSTMGQTVNFIATVVGQYGGTATGTATFKDGTNTVLGTASLVNGTATFQISSLGIGSHTITAVYAGDNNFNRSTSNAITQTVVSKTTTTTTVSSSLNPSFVGQSVTFTATVSPSAATGTVTFQAAKTMLDAASLSSGQATFSTSSLSAGSFNIVAVYSGDTQYASSTSAALTQAVNKATTTTTLTSAPNPSSVGQLVTFTATVTSSTGVTATGSVSFNKGTTTLGTATLNSAGTATFSTSALAKGKDNIKAVYGGSSAFSGSTSTVVTQVVQ